MYPLVLIFSHSSEISSSYETSDLSLELAHVGQKGNFILVYNSSRVVSHWFAPLLLRARGDRRRSSPSMLWMPFVLLGICYFGKGSHLFSKGQNPHKPKDEKQKVRRERECIPQN